MLLVLFVSFSATIITGLRLSKSESESDINAIKIPAPVQCSAPLCSVSLLNKDYKKSFLYLNNALNFAGNFAGNWTTCS